MASSLSLTDVAVTFSYGPSTVRALRGVSLDLQIGEFVVVIGSNGAGKSTLVNSVTGSVSVTSGTVRIGDRVVTTMAEHHRARLIGRVFQGTTTGVCRELTVTENLMVACSRGQRRSIFRPAVRRSRVDEARDLLTTYGVGLESSMTRPAALLSGGQQQLLSLVMAGMTKPEVLLLDEHTSALDPSMAALVMDSTERMVRAGGLTTLMITHNMRHAAEFGDRVIIMDGGRIVSEISGAERAAMDEAALIQRFRGVTSSGISDDMLG